MSPMLGRCTVLAASLSLAACGTYVNPTPGSITLQDAMESVGEGLHKMKVAEKDTRTGLVPDEVEVTFNVSASGEQNGKLYVELSPIPVDPKPIDGKVGAEAGGKYTAERGNQIKITFKNIMFVDPGKTLIKNASDARAFLDVINDPKYRKVVYQQQMNLDLPLNRVDQPEQAAPQRKK